MQTPIHDTKLWHVGKKTDWAQIQNTGKEKTLTPPSPKEFKSAYNKKTIYNSIVNYKSDEMDENNF